MADPITALVVGGTTLLSNKAQSDAAESAANAQSASSAAGIAEQRRQFEALQKILEPYVKAGTGAIDGLSPYAQAGAPALQQQQAIAGLLGPTAQAQAIRQMESSPLFQAQMRQGENAMLQNASATGGLRGGNIQGALAQFRPQMLSAEIDKQYSRLGGLTALGQMTQQNLAQLGQASAAGSASAGMQSAGNIAGLLAQQGAAQAGGILGQSAAFSNTLSAIPQGLAMWGGMTGRSPFGGTYSTPGIASGGGLMADLKSYGVF